MPRSAVVQKYKRLLFWLISVGIMDCLRKCSQFIFSHRNVACCPNLPEKQAMGRCMENGETMKSSTIIVTSLSLIKMAIYKSIDTCYCTLGKVYATSMISLNMKHLVVDNSQLMWMFTFSDYLYPVFLVLITVDMIDSTQVKYHPVAIQ